MRWASVVTAILCVCCVARSAHGDAFTYSTERRVVKAALLVSSATDMGNAGPESPDPYVFYVMDARTDLKPFGMDFVNPLAPPVITADIYKRWFDRKPANDPAFIAGTPQYQAFQVGATVTKNMGAYWEINLDNLSVDDLRQFDILFLHTHRANVAFTPAQLEKMRGFVEGGGTLWVDNCGGFTFASGAPFLYDVQFNNDGGGTNNAAVSAAPNHPLLTYPFAITAQELQHIGDKSVANYYIYDSRDTNSPTPGGYTLAPVVWNTRGYAPSGIQANSNWRPYVIAGQVGAGRLVICTQDTGCAINDYVGGVGGNTGALSGTNLTAAHAVDLKFGYNLAAWATANTTAQSNVHRTASSGEHIAGALEEKWSVATSGGNNPSGGAVFYKECVFAVDGNLVLHCYNAFPGLDLDGDNNPDQGIPDYIGGSSYDEIWRFDLKTVASGATAASTPTIIEFYDPNFAGRPAPGGLANFNMRELVLVTLSDGTTVALRALPRTTASMSMPMAANTVVDWVFKPQSAQDFGLPATRPLPSPAWSEGVVFAVANTSSGGKVYALDPRAGLSAFHPGTDGYSGNSADETGVPNSSQMGGPVGTPSAGYIKDVSTGAQDKMVYVNTATAANGPAGIRAIWFQTKGEPLTAIAGGTNTFRSRANYPWYDATENRSLAPRVFARYANAAGTVFTQELAYTGPGGTPSDTQFSVAWGAQNETITTGAQIAFTGGPTVASNDGNVTLFANYALDWPGTAASSGPKVGARSTLAVPDPGATGGNSVTGSGVVTADDTVLYTVDTVGSASAGANGRGVLLNVSEQSPSSKTTMKWAYVMHNGYTATVNSQSVTVPPRLRQLDTTMPNPGQYITDVQFRCSPAYYRGVAYAVATGSVGGTPVSLLCAFNANPDLKLRLNQKIDAGTPVRVYQVNTLSSSTTSSRMELSPQQFTVDYASGLIRIISMAPAGNTQNFVSASMPFIVQVGNSSEVMVSGQQVDTVTGTRESRPIGPDGVDNLLWYMVIPATLPGSGVALGAVTSSPSIQSDVIWLGFANGAIMSVDADPAASDPSAAARGAQVHLYKDDGTNLHLRWVQVLGVSTPVLDAPIANENVLAANTAGGIRTYEDSRTLIADSRRVLEVNAAGETVWSCDGTRTYGVSGGDLPTYTTASNVATGVGTVFKVPFSRPNVARRLGRNDLLVVDTGNNRVLQMDRGGNVVWEVSQMGDDLKGLLRPGDPLTLNEPTDCQYWTEFVSDLSAWGGTSVRATLPAVPGYVIHYLIADSGNFRVIELVDVLTYTGATVVARQVNFVSSTYAREGKRLKYRTVERIIQRNGDLPTGLTDPSRPASDLRYLTLTMVTNYRLVTEGTTGAVGLNEFGDRSASSGGSLMLLGETGLPVAIVSSLRVPDTTMPDGYRSQPIVSPTWFSKVDEVSNGTLTFKYLLADANGCYQLNLGLDGSGKPVLNVEWMLSGYDYYHMTGKRLIATCIRRLAKSAGNPNMPMLRQFLITNRFSGEDDPSVFTGVAGNNSAFGGEAFVLSPWSFTFNTSDSYAATHGYRPDWVVSGTTLVPNGQGSIVWRAPSEIWSSVAGKFLRSIGSTKTATQTSVLEQPSFADRPF